MEEKKRICKVCGTKLNKDDKHSRCDKCRVAQRDKWKARLKIGAIVAAFLASIVGLIYLSSKNSDEDFDDIIPESEPEHAEGQKYWNEKSQNWEKDGKPYTYRVTYIDARDGEIHTHNYADVDNGYEDYAYYRKQWYTSNAHWDHIPPEDDEV